MSIERATPSLCVAAAMLVASGAVAQVQPQDLRRIEQGTTDANPLEASQLVMPLDLRQPNDFETVYEIEGPGGSRQYVRFAGGTAAVFPRSVYVPTRNGVMVDVPPDTRFYIGGVPESMVAPRLPAAPGPYRVSYRVGRSAESAGEPRAETEPATVSIWAGEDVRRRRVSFLLRSAAAAAHGD